MSEAYGESAVSRAMKVARSSIYYEPDEEKQAERTARHEADLLEVRKAFEENHNDYGARRLKDALAEKGTVMSRRKIRRLMGEQNLVSSYGKPKYVKPGTKSASSNHADTPNLLGRNFKGWSEKEVIVSDLTYVKAGGKWCYICVLIDLFNREVVGWSAGKSKTPELVTAAFAMAGIDWRKVMVFHTDRGMEFCARLIDEFLDRNGIIRSLSRPGTPHDNAVSESFYKTVKKEFVKKQDFGSLENLRVLFGDWIHWYNNLRFHSADGNLPPVEFRKQFYAASLKKFA